MHIIDSHCGLPKKQSHPPVSRLEENCTRLVACHGSEVHLASAGVRVIRQLPFYQGVLFVIVIFLGTDVMGDVVARAGSCTVACHDCIMSEMA